MYILQNTLLTGIFLAVNIISAAFFILSFIRKEYRTAFYGMLAQTIISVFYFFLSYIAGGVFILSHQHDFTANLVYFLSILSALSNAVFGMKMYYHHRVVARIFIQLGIFFSAILVTTQLSDSAYNYWLQQKSSRQIQKESGFNQAPDFTEENAAGNSDSTTK